MSATPGALPVALPDWPAFGLSDDVRPAMAQAAARAEPFALATLMAAEGGAPRPLGAQMLVGAGGLLSGYLSGGCVEGDVVAHAAATLADGEPRRLRYGEGGDYPDIRLLCGGAIEVLVEAVAPDDPAVTTVLQAAAARRPMALSSDGRTRRAVEAAAEPLVVSLDPFVVVRAYAPVPRLIVVGADPTALAIASLGLQAGLETWLVRPKGPEVPPPLAGVRYDRRAPEVALPAIGLDPWTHVAVATHELESDEAALLTALPSPAAYVGVLGARRRIPERLARLRAAGIGEAALSRLHAPIGLDLGGKSPFEIAVAVLAQVIAAAHGA